MAEQAQDIVSVFALQGTVRHLIDPHSDSWAGPEGGGSTLTVACGRRLFVVYDGQHDRPLCEGCRRWLRQHLSPSPAGREEGGDG